MKKPKPRDKSFLTIAAFAGFGGLLAIGVSIGLPVHQAMTGGHPTPAFFFFGIWGFAALLGCAGCIHTYVISGDPPDKPPKGGVPVRAFTVIEGSRKQTEVAESKRRAA